MAKTKTIGTGQRIAGRLLEVTARTKAPIFRRVEGSDGSIELTTEGWLVTPEGARGLGLSSDGRYVSILIDGIPRMIPRCNVRYVEETGR